MTWRRLLRVPLRAMAAATLLVAMAAPVYIFIKAEQTPDLPARLHPPVVALDAVSSVRVPAYRDAVPVLTYHDISNRPGRYTVSPAHFAQQMAALHRAGFHTIRVAQLLAFLHDHRQLPERPLLITFDDGLGSVWRAADPILASYGFHGVSFVISGQVGRHGYYYLQPSELRAMVRSGRWDIEAHTHLAHFYVATDGAGHFGPALTDRAWLPRQGRLETEAEFAARIARDLDRNIAELRGYGVDPLLFAYPFSAARAPTNDLRVIPVLNALVARRFGVSFLDSDGGRSVNRYDGMASQSLPRIEVYHVTSASGLVERLSAIAPVHARLDGFPSSRRWILEGGSALPPRALVRGGVLTLRAAPRHWLAADWAPGSTELWDNYRVGVTVHGLGHEGSGTSDTLTVGAGSSERYAITSSAGRLSVSGVSGRGSARGLRHASYRSAPSHRLDVALGQRHLTVAVDGRVLIKLVVPTVTHGGIGFGAWRTKAASPMPSFSDLSVKPLG